MTSTLRPSEANVAFALNHGWLRRTEEFQRSIGASFPAELPGQLRKHRVLT